MYKSIIRLLVPTVLTIMLSACAQSPVLSPQTAQLPERVELSDVPFFPQTEYQCGPAALSTMLTQRGVATSPGLLKDQVYIPGREGSLQIEMVAAARAHDMLVYPLQPKLESILNQVAAGNPVLVLQNQAFDWYPQWHFAVVVGFDLRAKTLILRSGTTRRWATDFAGFDESWARAKRWAVVTMPPNKLPANPEMQTWLKAASDLEETDHKQAALSAYRTATRQWPNEALTWFAMANSRHAGGDAAGAEADLRKSVQHKPDFAAGWFNLSQVLAERGCGQQAAQAQACAKQLAPKDERFGSPLKVATQAAGQCSVLQACSTMQ